jgi:NADH:ubiquinone oxidoreductase subunit 3 (subunit A)
MGVLSVFVFVAMCVVVVAYLVFADSVLKNNKKDKDKQNQRGN